MADQTSGGVNINENADAYNRNFNGGVQMNPFLINFSDPLCGFDPEEQLDGVKMSELGDFVGTNTHYYLPIFKRFKDTKRSASWNFCSALFPEFYFSYRKMPLAALAAVIIRQITQLPQYIVLLSQSAGLGRLSEAAASVDVRSAAFQGLFMLCSAMMYAFMFTAGIFGNKLYYGSAVRKIKRTTAHTTRYAARLNYRKGRHVRALAHAVYLPDRSAYAYTFLQPDDTHDERRSLNF